MEFKIVLVGSANSGKTTYITRLLTGEFNKTYIPTLGVDVHPLTFNTTKGYITFNVWDCAGEERFGGLRDGYYLGAKGCIALFDLTRPATIERTLTLQANVIQSNGPIPTIFCGSKRDLVEAKQTSIEQKRSLALEHTYFDISAKSNYQYEKPFLYLARKLTGDSSLEFVPNEAVAPPMW